MLRLAMFAGILGAACSGAPPPTPTNAEPGAGPAVYAKKIALSWAFQKVAVGTEVFLQTTDETGKQVSYSLGSFEGDCKPNAPSPDMKAVTGAACFGSASPVELHAVVHDRDVVVLKLRADATATAGGRPDPMSREELQRIPVPPGAGVGVGP